jgi:hypothetical protein
MHHFMLRLNMNEGRGSEVTIGEDYIVYKLILEITNKYIFSFDIIP